MRDPKHGKEAFKIVYFFWCDECRLNVNINFAHHEEVPIIDELNDELKRKLKDLGNPLTWKQVSKLLCSDCLAGALKCLSNLDVIGRRFLIPSAKNVFELEIVRESIAAAISRRGGQSYGAVIDRLKFKFDPILVEENDGLVRKIHRFLFKEYAFPEYMLEPSPEKLNYYLSVSAKPSFEFTLTAIKNKKRLRDFISPYLHTYKELTK